MEAFQLLEQGWGAMNSAALERCCQLMVDFRKELLLSMGASATTNMASGGSISPKQQIGTKRGAMPNISQELIGSSPNTTKTHIGTTLVDYKEVLVVLKGGCQYVTLRRFGVWIVMVWHWLQEIPMQITAKIVRVSCHCFEQEPWSHCFLLHYIMWFLYVKSCNFVS